MILDTLQTKKTYANLHPGIGLALDFLSDEGTAQLADGKYEIDGEKVYASISTETGKGRDDGRLETHKKYIDVQFCLEGTDLIGWKPADETLETVEEYNVEKDIAFFGNEPEEYFTISGNTFCILFPNDAHAPLSGTGNLRKIVVKIEV